jgi:hypothetical protein
LGTLGQHYQRAEETPGTFWFDIDRPENAPFPDPNRVRAAASNAIASLKDEASPGRRPDKVMEFLAFRFREIFLRFNDRITRHSVQSSRETKKKSTEGIRETRAVQLEAGPFITFLELVLEPLNRFFQSLPKDHGAGCKSAKAVAEMLRDRRGKRPHWHIRQRGSWTACPIVPITATANFMAPSCSIDSRESFTVKSKEKHVSEFYTAGYLQEHLQVPDVMLPFALATPRLLPGETDDDFYRLFDMMATELLPDTDLQWLWVIDLTWLWFDIVRYRRWKSAIILTSRRAALEFALAKTDPESLQISGMNPMIRAQARVDAEVLRVDKNNRNALSVRLEAHGYNADAVNASAFVEGRESLATIEKFLTSARHQVAAMVREIRLDCAFVQRAREAIDCNLAKMKLADQASAESKAE